MYHFNHSDFLQEAYREEVKFNIYEYAAQKILKFDKLRKEKKDKLHFLSKPEWFIYTSFLVSIHLPKLPYAVSLHSLTFPSFKFIKNAQSVI